jgi:hypothetical protein
MSSLVDEVLASVMNKEPGLTTWFGRLPPAAQAELEQVRQSYDPAVHQKRAFYKAIAAAAEKRGWHIAGEKQVGAWLENRR